MPSAIRITPGRNRIGKSMPADFKIIDPPIAIRIEPEKKLEFIDNFLEWGEWWGSNPRPPEPQPGALPTELHSPLM